MVLTKQKRPAEGRQGPPCLGLWVARRPVSTVKQGVRANFQTAIAVYSTSLLGEMSRARCGGKDQDRIGRKDRAGGRAPRHEAAERVRLFGLHAVEAALANPRRKVVRVLATENAAHRLQPLLASRGLDARACQSEGPRPASGPRHGPSGRPPRCRAPAPSIARRCRGRRHAARARSGDRPAECRSGVALGRGVRGFGSGSHRAAQPAAFRRARQSRKRRARHRTGHPREEPRARLGGARRRAAFSG